MSFRGNFNFKFKYTIFTLLIITIYHQADTSISLANTSISFWYKWRLNLKSLIKKLKTLPIELTRTHQGQQF